MMFKKYWVELLEIKKSFHKRPAATHEPIAITSKTLTHLYCILTRYFCEDGTLFKIRFVFLIASTILDKTIGFIVKRPAN